MPLHPGAAGVFGAETTRKGRSAGLPGPGRSARGPWRQPKTKTTTDHPGDPRPRRSPRRRRADAKRARTCHAGPYDLALAAGEELRRKPYVAAGTVQIIRQHAKDRMTVWERIEVLQDPDTHPTVLYQNWGPNLDGASMVTGHPQDPRPRRRALRPRLHRARRLDGRHQRPQAGQPDLPGRRTRHPAASA